MFFYSSLTSHFFPYFLYLVLTCFILFLSTFLPVSSLLYFVTIPPPFSLFITAFLYSQDFFPTVSYFSFVTCCFQPYSLIFLFIISFLPSIDDLCLQVAHILIVHFVISCPLPPCLPLQTHFSLIYLFVTQLFTELHFAAPITHHFYLLLFSSFRFRISGIQLYEQF